MRALVTGGCGFIGSNLVHGLVTRGWQVDIVDDLSNGYMQFLDGISNVRAVLSTLLPYYQNSSRAQDTVLMIEGDIEDRNVLTRIESGAYNVIFHMAANPRVTYTVEQPAITFDINVTRTIRILESIRNSSRPIRFIFSSTSAVYGNNATLPTPVSQVCAPLSPYGLQKLTIEEFLKQATSLYGIDAVSLRYANVYGPRQLGNSPYSTAISAWCNCVNEGLPLRSDGDGEQTRDMVYVDDVVRANILAATRVEPFKGEVFNVGTGTRVSNNTILSFFKERFGELQVNTAPPRPGDVRDTQLDISHTAQGLGWTPKVSLEEGLMHTWKWWGF